MGSNKLSPGCPEGDWQAEEDLRTVSRAREIQKDPKRWARCQALAGKKVLELAALAGKEKE